MAKNQVIQEGYIVALCLVPETAPKNSYIGLVKAIDEYGLRINEVRWDEKLDVISPSTEDFFAPWKNINSMTVCTEEHPVRRFVRDRAPKWRSEVEAMCSKESHKAKKTKEAT